MNLNVLLQEEYRVTENESLGGSDGQRFVRTDAGT
jgi:hypothetical protein